MNRFLVGFVLLAASASLGVLWLTGWPLGVPGEWTWDRMPTELDSGMNGLGAAVAAGLFVVVVRVGWKRMNRVTRRPVSRGEVCGWLVALVGMSFAWLWIVQEAAPVKNRLGKAAFVLYYSSSSGYFTKARYEEPSPGRLLAGYEDLMRERDVLHVGTHPPGLFLVFQGLIAACEFSPPLAAFLDATQPASFREACDVIATNSLRAKSAHAVLPLDRRVLWLATLLVMLSVSLVVVPLYGVVRLTHDRAAAWLTAALWPAVPAAAVFVPKSDVVYALVGMMFVWLWLLAVKRRSMGLALLAGLIAWCGLMCSLAFLPVFLFAGLVTLGARSFGLGLVALDGNEEDPLTLTLSPEDGGEGTGRETLEARCSVPVSQLAVPISQRPAPFVWLSTLVRQLIPTIAAAAMGFIVPTLWLGWLGRVNLLVVWWLNYQNHAGFYAQYQRTYWKWLLVNPVELCLAAGVPVALLAAMSVLRLTKERRSTLMAVAWSMLFVGGLLWLTGKNSGEAARLWIVFLPWLVWLAGPLLAEAETNSKERWLRPAWIVMAIQFMVCLLTVARVSGFHFE